MLEQADRVDNVLAVGNDPGPLAGVPVTVKINIDQAGFANDRWQLFLNKYAVLLIPVSAELPFPDGLDLEGNGVGVQIVASRYREDLCLRAA